MPIAWQMVEREKSAALLEENGTAVVWKRAVTSLPSNWMIAVQSVGSVPKKNMRNASRTPTSPKNVAGNSKKIGTLVFPNVSKKVRTL